MAPQYQGGSAGGDDWDNDWDDPFTSETPEDVDPFASGTHADADLEDPFVRRRGVVGGGRSPRDRGFDRERGCARKQPLEWRPRRATSLPHQPGHAEPPGSEATRRPRESTYIPLVLVVIGGVIAAVMLYLGLAEVHPLSLDPLGNSLVFFTLSTAGLILATFGLAFAVWGAALARPLHRPVLAIVLALTFVPLLVLGAGNLGVNDAKRRFHDSASSGLGRTLIGILTIMEDEGIPLGPFGELTD